MEKKIIICIGGFSNSGKSTTVKILESLGVPVFSASRFLHKAVDLANETFFKADRPDPINYRWPTNRQQCITMAEEILVPTFGRRLFAHAMFDGVIESPERIVAIESIGEAEWEEFAKLARGHHLEIWNIRSLTEKPGIDIRELIPDGMDLWNTGTIEDLEKRIAKLHSLLLGVSIGQPN